MLKQQRKSLLCLLMAIIAGLMISGCGGGGGGTPAAAGGTTNNNPGGGTTADKTFVVTGTVSATAAAREAGRAVKAPVANTTIVAYALSDESRRALNTTATTDANGNFSITVNIGSAANADIIIEALAGGAAVGSTATYKVALEDAASNLTGVAANETTTAESQLWIHNKSEGLAATIKPIVALLTSDVINKVRAEIDSSGKGQQIVTAMKSIVASCGSKTGTEKKSCIITEIESRNTAAAGISDSTVALVLNELQDDYVQDKVNSDVASATPGEKLVALDTSATLEDANIVATMTQELIAYSADVSNAFDAIDQSNEAREMFSQLAPAIADYKSGSSTARAVAVKDEVMATLKGSTFTLTQVQNLLTYLKAGYSSKIAAEAVAATTKVTASDLTSIISGWDVIRGALIGIFAKDVPASRDKAWSMVNSFVAILSKLGEASESTASMADVLDKWVTANDDTKFLDNMYALLDPMGMDNHAKTAYLMQIIHGLSHTDGTRPAVLVKFTEYKDAGKMSAETVDYAMVMYDKYYGKSDCGFDVASRSITGSNCPTVDEITKLMSLYYDKSDLPILRAVLNSILDWVKTSSDVLGLATAGTAMQNVYNQMKADAAAKTELGGVMDTAGVPKELFWLAINLAPYLSGGQ